MDGCIGLSEQDASYYFTTDVRDPKTAKAAGGAPRIDIAAFSKARPRLHERARVNSRNRVLESAGPHAAARLQEGARPHESLPLTSRRTPQTQLNPHDHLSLSHPPLPLPSPLPFPPAVPPPPPRNPPNPPTQVLHEVEDTLHVLRSKLGPHFEEVGARTPTRAHPASKHAHGGARAG